MDAMFRENAVFALEKNFQYFFFSRKQDVAIDHTLEGHTSLPSLHVSEKSTRLPTSLGQGISLLRTVARLSL